jgi:hypothetical protein
VAPSLLLCLNTCDRSWPAHLPFCRRSPNVKKRCRPSYLVVAATAHCRCATTTACCRSPRYPGGPTRRRRARTRWRTRPGTRPRSPDRAYSPPSSGRQHRSDGKRLILDRPRTEFKTAPKRRFRAVGEGRGLLPDATCRSCRPPADRCQQGKGRLGPASPSGSACDRHRHTGARFVLAGRALRVPVASAPDGSSRSTTDDHWKV